LRRNQKLFKVFYQKTVVRFFSGDIVHELEKQQSCFSSGQCPTCAKRTVNDDEIQIEAAFAACHSACAL